MLVKPVSNRSVEDYIRFDHKKEESAVVHLLNPLDGRLVDLVSAIHVGSTRYYREVMARLGECDAVLYERILPTPDKIRFRDHFRICNLERLHEFYRGFAQKMTEIHVSRIESIEEDILQEFPGEKKELKALFEGCKSEVNVIMQGDAIDYGNLPDNWYHADITQEEFNRLRKALSIETLQLALLRLVSEVCLRSDKAMTLLVKERCNKGYISGGVEPLPRTSRFREQRAWQVFNELDADVHRVGIFYGTNHIPYLEERFTNARYVRKDMEFIEAIRKKPTRLE